MIYKAAIMECAKMLRNLTLILDKASSFAEKKKIETEVLLQSRLAPDQFNFIRQIQIACDTAKLGTARLTNKEAPSHQDTEINIADLKARIQSTVSYLETFTDKDFEATSERRISTPRWEDKTLSGEEFFHQHMIPNFYFHVTTAYSILRHNGVEIGKKDYLGDMPFKK